MNFPKKALIGSLLLMSATSVFAVDTADLTVIGTIAPTACTPTFAGGGVVDYGNIPTASLSPTVRTTLAAMPIAYTIHCDAPISVGTSFTDSRAASSTGGVNLNLFGLGMQGANKIGNYSIAHVLTAATGDGAPVAVIQRTAPGGAWVAPTNGFASGDGVVVYSFAPTGTLVPGTYSDFGGSLNIAATIAPTDTLDLSSSITLDGLSTMTVRYL